MVNQQAPNGHGIREVIWKADCIATSNRAGGVLLVHLRSGHASLLKAYARLLDPVVDPTCPLHHEGPQTVEHWLQRCPNLDFIGTIYSPMFFTTLDVITIDPGEALALTSATF